MEHSRRGFGALVGLGVAGTARQALAQRTEVATSFEPGDVKHRHLAANGINFHIAEQGKGPLVLLCHGFPETWRSWRHQLPVVAKAGFHAVAPDMRGYGQSDAPPDIASYTIMDLVGDMVGLVAALGEKQAIIVGHDWGATVAWHAALLRPDLFPAVVAMSVPFRQRGPVAPLRQLRDAGLNTHYWLYYQQVGVAEAELERDVRSTIRRRMYANSGDRPSNSPSTRILQPGEGVLHGTIDPEQFPVWLTPADLDYLVAEYTRTGFRGGLNYYRNLDRNWELLAPWAGAAIRPRALFIAGTKDQTIGSNGGSRAEMEAMKTTVPNLERSVMIEGAGHYTPEERPQQVNEALIQFLRGVTVSR